MNFDSPISKAITYLFPGDCFDEIFHKFHFIHETCLPIVVSRVLGLAITLGSLMVLVPQIIKIWRAGNAQGISATSMLLNLAACVGVCGYSYRQRFVFSQWGDALFVAMQVAVIVLQIFYYSGQTPQIVMLLAVLSSIVGAIYMDAIPLTVLASVQAATIPITVVGKAMQLHANYTARSTGQLSGVSTFMQFAGCLARIFTSIQETGDVLVIVTYVIASLMNGLIFAQMFIYWDQPVSKVKRA